MAYPLLDGQVLVFDERPADYATFSRFDTASFVGSDFRATARAYFEAHPESRPWEDAEQGEI